MRTMLTSIIFFTLLISCQKKEIVQPKKESQKANVEIYKAPDLKTRITEAEDFAKKNAMNEDFCILIDLGIHSGRNRFFVYNFKEKKITQQWLVGHGCGNYGWTLDESRDNASFSNVEDSHLSALGKYKIGNRGYSSFGVNINYIMHGLEETNSNAVKRIIVFHSWELVADEEVFPAGTPEGWGCPTISNKNFLELDPVLKYAKKPVLMWIYSSKLQR